MSMYGQRTGAEIIIDQIERQGVRIVAGIPGGALLPLYEALGRSLTIRHILARHEQAAGFIAQGMARMTGKAGVCFATSGPGVTNILTALADAKLDSIPLVCFAGQVPAHLIGTDAFQEVPTIDLARPITKACFFVRSAAQLAEVIPEAFRIAESGRPGPVLIDVPKNVQVQRCSYSLAASGRGALVTSEAARTSSDTNQTARERRAVDAHGFDTAAEMIAAAERPVLYVGGGVVKARAHLLIRELAERKLFFRRLRLPPLLHVFWDRMLITPWMRAVLRCMVLDHQRTITEGWHALQTLNTMQQLAMEHDLPQQGLQLQYDTFELLATAREYFFSDAPVAIQERLAILHKRYRATHRQRYALQSAEAAGVLHSRYFPFLLRIVLREQRGYRLIDHLLVLQLPTLLTPLLRRWYRQIFPPSTRAHGMGIEVVLK